MIITLDKKYEDQLAEIDLESKHQMESHLTLSDYKQLLHKRFKQNHELFFGLKEDNVLKGYTTIKPFFPGHNHCELYWLSVRKKYQGQGIGTKLMDFIESYAKKKGFRKICLYTHKLLEEARTFYEKRGYVLINEFPEYYDYAKDNTAVLYVKKL